MTGLVTIASSGIEAGLPALIDRASRALAAARGSAKVLEARDAAALAYDAAKRAARLAAAKGAHDNLVAAAHRAQADALHIEAQAKIRLADEYDAAQERGEVQRHGGQGNRDVPGENIPTVEDIGLTRKDVFEARQIRDAERDRPGVVREVLNRLIETGDEPTRAAVKREVMAIAKTIRAERADQKRAARAKSPTRNSGGGWS